METGYYLALGVALLPFFVQFVWPVPKAVAWAGVTVAIAIIFLEFLSPQMRPPLISVTLFVVGALCIGAGIYFWTARGSHVQTAEGTKPVADKAAINVVGNNNIVTVDQNGNISIGSPAPKKEDDDRPDVVMRLVYPDLPALVLVNRSGVLAEQIKISVALWNLDDPRTYQNPGAAPTAHDPLPIPVDVFDFIRPHVESGVQSLLGKVSSFVKDGQRVFGSIGIVCPKCGRGHTYIVDTTIGKGGWYTEVLDLTEGQLIVPPHFTKTLVQDYAKEISAKTPTAARVEIMPN